MKSGTSSGKLPFGKAFRQGNAVTRAALLLASWFGVGLLPRAPGTFGTLAALPAVLLVRAAGTLGGLVLILAFLALSVWAAGIAERVLGRTDPGEVVADEVAGFMVTLYLLPLSWPYLAGGFLLFRLLDIAKPFPIRRIERIQGGAGVILDDVAAGLIANLILRGGAALFQ